MDLGWQFNVENWYFFLIFQVSAQAQGSLEHGAFIVKDRGLQAFQLALRFFIEHLFIFGFFYLISVLIRGIGIGLLAVRIFFIHSQVFGRFTTLCKPLFLKFSELGNELLLFLCRLGIIIKPISCLFMESSIVQVASINLDSRFAFGNALNYREFLEYCRSHGFNQQLQVTVPFSSLKRHAMKVTGELYLGAIFYGGNVEIHNFKSVL